MICDNIFKNRKSTKVFRSERYFSRQVISFIFDFSIPHCFNRLLNVVLTRAVRMFLPLDIIIKYADHTLETIRLNYDLSSLL